MPLYLCCQSLCRLERYVSELGGLINWPTPISRKKKRKVSHQERCARAKVSVRKFRCRALSVALVVHCWRRPSNKRSPLVTSVSTTSEPMRWKWKKEAQGWFGISHGKSTTWYNCQLL